MRLVIRWRQAGVFGGEGEGFEAAGFDIHRIVAQAEPATRRQRPRRMRAAGQHAQMESVTERNGYELVVGQDGELLAQDFALFPKEPPVVAVGSAVVLVALRLHTFKQPLVSRRKL